MRTNFVLIDSENVTPEHVEKLNHEHFRVVVFLGAGQTRISTALGIALQSLAGKGSYVQVSGKGKDALDFHIAYHIGKLSAANPDAFFHIISKDKGYDPLIKHLWKEKIFCSRVSSVTEIPLLKSLDKAPPKVRAARFYEKRIASAKNRPTTVTTLRNAILSHFHKQLHPEEVSKVVESLKQAHQVVVNGTKVTYPGR